MRTTLARQRRQSARRRAVGSPSCCFRSAATRTQRGPMRVRDLFKRDESVNGVPKGSRHPRAHRPSSVCSHCASVAPMHSLPAPSFGCALDAPAGVSLLDIVSHLHAATHGGPPCDREMPAPWPLCGAQDRACCTSAEPHCDIVSYRLTYAYPPFLSGGTVPDFLLLPCPPSPPPPPALP